MRRENQARGVGRSRLELILLELKGKPAGAKPAAKKPGQSS